MKIKLDSHGIKPTRAHDTDAGLDLYCTTDAIIPARESLIVKTGVHIQLPHNTVGLIKSKSGLNVKNGIVSEGVIDEGYSGEIIVKLYNNSPYDYVVKRKDKIAQLLIVPCFYFYVELVDHIESGERGENGFGSTGR